MHLKQLVNIHFIAKFSRIRLGTQADFGKKVKTWECALDQTIDITPKVPAPDVITAMHCLDSLKLLVKH